MGKKLTPTIEASREYVNNNYHKIVTCQHYGKAIHDLRLNLHIFTLFHKKARLWLSEDRSEIIHVCRPRIILHKSQGKRVNDYYRFPHRVINRVVETSAWWDRDKPPYYECRGCWTKMDSTVGFLITIAVKHRDELQP
jgi:hypothetical protein